MDQNQFSFSAASFSSKLPMSRLPTMSTQKKRAALEEANDQPANKSFRSSADSVGEIYRPLATKKAIAVVKPAQKSTEPKPPSVVPARQKTTANKLKRRSVAVLNKKTVVVRSNSTKIFSSTSSTFAKQRSSENLTKFSRPNSSSRQSNESNDSKKKTRPGWDLKGRLADLEEKMQLRDAVTSSLQNRLLDLEKQNVQLETAAEQKQQITEEACAQLDDLRRKFEQKSTAFEELDRKFNRVSRENEILQNELNCATIKINELTKSLSELSASQISVNVQLQTARTSLADFSEKNQSLSAKIVELDEKFRNSEEKCQKLEMIRRKLHNTVQELKGNIRVFCRVRPLLSAEMLAGNDNRQSSHILCPKDDFSKIEIINASSESNVGGAKRQTKHEFEFDRVFDAEADQLTVFEEISQLVQSAMDGYNVCIFAYGQTGSGKTYTMQGPEDVELALNPVKIGMIPLAVKQIFSSAQELMSKGWQYKFEASYLEIYNEKIRDLLTTIENNEDQNLEIKLTAAAASSSKNSEKGPNEIYVPGLTLKTIENEEQVEELISFAMAKRAKAATKCNARSSRSHSVFRLRISGRNTVTDVTCDGLLSLVDLAGSERLKESQSEGDRLKEAQNINKSLSTLGQVITSLSQKDAHIPYRNSRLTFLLQNSLGGNSKTLMFVNISPNLEHASESINSLKFAAKVNQCHIGAAFKKN